MNLHPMRAGVCYDAGPSSGRPGFNCPYPLRQSYEYGTLTRLIDNIERKQKQGVFKMSRHLFKKIISVVLTFLVILGSCTGMLDSFSYAGNISDDEKTEIVMSGDSASISTKKGTLLNGSNGSILISELNARLMRGATENASGDFVWEPESSEKNHGFVYRVSYTMDSEVNSCGSERQSGRQLRSFYSIRIRSQSGRFCKLCLSD